MSKPSVCVRIVCGARDWSDVDYIYDTMSQLFRPKYDILIHGGADGADCIAEMVGFALGMKDEQVHRMPADWEKYGRPAGPIRNSEMLKLLLELTKSDPWNREVVAYHPFIENSKGTKDMVGQAKRKGVDVTLLGGRSA